MNLTWWSKKIQLGCFFLWLLAFWIAVTVNFSPIYYYFVYQNNLGAKIGLSNGELISQYHQLMAYLNFPWISSLNLKIKMSANGLSHFADVKQLFILDYVCLAVTSFVAVKEVYEMHKNNAWWQLYQPVCYILAVVLGIFTIAILDFSDFFISFHQLLFRNQNWVFDPKTDPIIKVLPESFFTVMFVFFFILFLGSLFWCLIISRKNLLKKKRGLNQK
jgi:integral membrane protein (TIGR01906 family)